jgi:hypothetical protein
MHRFAAIAAVLFFSSAFATSDDSLVKKTMTVSSPGNSGIMQYCRNVVGVVHPKSLFNENYIFDRSLYTLRIDTLPQVRFWRKVMNMHEDTALICVQGSRQILQRVSMKEWNSLPDTLKKCYRDSVKLCNSLDTSCRILITGGKKYFYDFERTSQFFERGIRCFMENEVDPWYAQAILLIESPNKLQKSNVGAYGPFQLMKSVARRFGLKVNRHVDERASFERSAFAAGSLLKKICIPYAYKLLDSLKITNVNEEDLWFRLLVMHIYHAGFGNVQKAIYSFNPTVGDMNIIYNLWQTQAGRFKSASQNYSQVILAAMLEMNERYKLGDIGHLQTGTGVSKIETPTGLHTSRSN